MKTVRKFFKYLFYGFILIIILLIITLLTSFLVNIIMISKTPLNIPVSPNSDWIGFFGSILGTLLAGLLSVFIFYKTVEYNEKQMKEQRKLEILPYLNYEIDYNYISNDNTKYIYLFSKGLNVSKCKKELRKYCTDTVQFDKNIHAYSDEDIKNNYREQYKIMDCQSNLELVKVHIIVKNLGMNHATDLDIKQIKFGEDEYNITHDLSITGNGKIHNEYGSCILRTDESFNINLNLVIDNSSNEKDESFDIDMIVAYKNLLRDRYEQKIRIKCQREKQSLKEMYRLYIHRDDVGKVIELKK